MKGNKEFLAPIEWVRVRGTVELHTGLYKGFLSIAEHLRRRLYGPG